LNTAYFNNSHHNGYADLAKHQIHGTCHWLL